MRDTKKTIVNSVIFILLIFITYYIIFEDQNIYDLYDKLKKLNFFYLIIGLLTMLLYFTIEAIKVRMILNSFGENTTTKKTLKYTLIGFFFSSITPAATGGQPMEVYYMSKEDIKLSHGTMALLIHLCGYQISTVLLGIVAAIFTPYVLKNELIYLFIVGTLFNMVPITITLIGIFNQKLSEKLVNIAIKFLKLIKVKDIDKITDKINEELVLFNESSEYIKAHKKDFYKSIVLSFIQILVFYSIPFFVYKSFNLTGFNIIDSIKFQSILHNTVCSMPLPGSVGITESVFLIIYGYVYPQGLIQSAVLINRFISFYMYVIVGLIVFLVTKMKLDKKKK